MEGNGFPRVDIGGNGLESGTVGRTAASTHKWTDKVISLFLLPKRMVMLCTNDLIRPCMEMEYRIDFICP